MHSLAHGPKSGPSTTAFPLASRWVLIAMSVLALALGACTSGNSAATPAPPSPAAPTPAGTQSATPPAPASPSTGDAGTGSDTIALTAQNIQFSTNQLQAPAGRAFKIDFENGDSGISHDVDILDASNASVFKGAIFAGVASQTYQVPALAAGTYSFICDVHPNIMTGTLTVS